MAANQTKSLQDAVKEQYRKCAQDPVYFMRKYCKIQHPTRGKIAFDLYDFQEGVLNDFKDNRFNVVLKSRQLGISTLVAGYSLWKMIFNDDFNVLVIATKQEVAKNLVLKVRVMNQFLPVWLRVQESEDNKLSLRLKNGSQIKAISSKPDAGRSEALSLLVFDEAAFIDYIEEIWTSAQSTLSTGGSCIALSTPNGIGNWFHQVWVGAENGENLFHPIKLHWTVHPERDISWREEQEKQLGQKGAAQECDCDFISSGATVISPELLVKYTEAYVKDPMYKRGFDNNLWVWEDPHYFGNFLINLSTEYNDALLIIDNASIGWTTIQQCLDRNYKNLFWSNRDVKYVDIDTQFTNKFYRDEKQMVPGFSISSKTRPLVISKIDTYMRDMSVIIRSKRTIDEFFTFIWNNGRAEAARGYNDDLVMALGMGLWIRDTALRLRQEGIDLTRRSIEGFVQTSHDSLYTPGMFGDDPYKMQTGKNDEFEDLRWLLR